MAIIARPSRSISMLLAAMTLATGLLPPVLGHEHPDGDRPHRHDRGHDHHAGPEHVEGHHAHHHRVATLEGPSVGPPATSHLHIDLGAFGLTVPTSPGPPGPDRPSPCDPAIRAADDEAIAARVEDARIAVSRPGSIADAWVDAPPPHTSLPRSAAPPGTSPPLCDAARHERSGVLRT